VFGHYRPILFENLHAPTQGFHVAVGTDHGPPGRVVFVNQALAVIEGFHHQVGPGGGDLGLDWA